VNAVWKAFAAVASLGLLLSLTVHLAALFGVALFGESAFALHVGMLAVGLPAGIATHRVTRDVARKDFWKVALSGCPLWMRRLSGGLVAYAILNFAYFALTLPSHGPKHSGAPDAAILRMFSGHWMAFYAGAVSIFYSKTRAEFIGAPRCTQGHPVGPSAKFCEQCGSPVESAPAPRVIFR